MTAESNQHRISDMADLYKKMINGRSFSLAAILEMSAICVNLRNELMEVGRMCHNSDGPVTGKAIREAASRLEVEQFMGDAVEEHNVFRS
jgi:hypothetical protein